MKYLTFSLFTFISFLLLSLWGLRVRACDYCGIYMGVRPNEMASRFDFLFRYRHLEGYHRTPSALNLPPQTHPFFRTAHDPALHDREEGKSVSYRPDDRNTFLTYELRSTFFVTPRFGIMAILPYHQNTLTLENDTKKGGGLGDISLLGNYFLKRSVNSKIQHNLILHGGIKLPTGYYVADGERFASESHLQAGTGSYDFFTGFTGSFRRKNWSTVSNVMYKLNTANYAGYRFGNSFNYTQTLYYDWYYCRHGTVFHLFPTAGVYYENSNGEFYQNKWQAGTGGQIWFATFGLEGQFGKDNRFGFMTSFQVPVWQDLLGVQLGAGGRMILGMNYNLSSDRRKTS